MSIILNLQQVSKRFGRQNAVSDVSLAVNKGSLHSLLGPSGCGKTTLLRMIAGLESPDSGDILLNGESLLSKKAYERNVSTVFQNYALFPHLNVAANISFGLKRRSLPQADILRRVGEMLTLLQLEDKAERFPSALSGGERQRVALARSLVIEPSVLLLDEPLSALDPNLRKQVRADLKALQRRLNATFVFVTHDQEEALSLSDEITVLNQGKVEQSGTPRDLYERPASRFVAEFLGEMNWVDPHFGIRPQATRILRNRMPTFPSAIPATIESFSYFGSRVQVRARLASGAAMIADVASSEAAYEPGEPVFIAWNQADELRPH